MKSLVELKAQAEAKAQRQAARWQIMAALPADASGREIVAALRQAPGTVSANQQAAKDRATERRLARGRVNQLKHEARVTARRAAKELVKVQATQAKAAQFAAVLAATVW